MNLSDDEYRDHVARLRQAITAAPSSAYSHVAHAGNVKGYSPERHAAHEAILDDAWAELGGDDIPKGRQGLILGGVPGSGKTSVRESATVPGVGPVKGGFLPIDSDYFKGKLIDAGLAPSLRGFSPMEAAPLMHKESNDIAKKFARRAYDQGTNLAWDYTLRHSSSGPNRLKEFGRYDYTPHGIYVHASPQEALSRVSNRHRDDLGQYMEGLHRHGGRYVPPEIITDSVHGSRIANRDNYDAIAHRLASSQIFDTSHPGTRQATRAWNHYLGWVNRLAGGLTYDDDETSTPGPGKWRFENGATGERFHIYGPSQDEAWKKYVSQVGCDCHDNPEDHEYGEDEEDPLGNAYVEKWDDPKQQYTHLKQLTDPQLFKEWSSGYDPETDPFDPRQFGASRTAARYKMDSSITVHHHSPDETAGLAQEVLDQDGPYSLWDGLKSTGADTVARDPSGKIHGIMAVSDFDDVKGMPENRYSVANINTSIEAPAGTGARLLQEAARRALADGKELGVHYVENHARSWWSAMGANLNGSVGVWSPEGHRALALGEPIPVPYDGMVLDTLTRKMKEPGPYDLEDEGHIGRFPGTARYDAQQRFDDDDWDDDDLLGRVHPNVSGVQPNEHGSYVGWAPSTNDPRHASRTAGLSDEPDDVTGDYSLAEFFQWCAHNRKDADQHSLAEYAAVSGMDNENYLDIYLFLSDDDGMFRQAATSLQQLHNINNVANHLGMDKGSLRTSLMRNEFPSPTHIGGKKGMLWDSLEPWEKWRAKHQDLRQQILAPSPLPEGWADEFKTNKEPQKLHTAEDIAQSLGLSYSAVKHWFNSPVVTNKPPPPSHQAGTGFTAAHLWDRPDLVQKWYENYRSTVTKGKSPGIPGPVKQTAPAVKAQDSMCPNCFTQHAGECL
jgi:hypothetical protein